MRNNEQGRSMIEMLGVLAIVGVLSVGGIAGYSKAMAKFKTNKAIDQINMISTNIRTLYSSQRNYDGLSVSLAKKVNLIPAEMYDTVSDSTITNAFGGTVSLSVGEATDANDKKAYIIDIDKIPSAACITIVTTDWGSDSDSGLIAMGANTGEDPVDLSTFHSGDAATATIHTPSSQEHGIPFNVSDSNTACGTNELATISWKYL